MPTPSPMPWTSPRAIAVALSLFGAAAVAAGGCGGGAKPGGGGGSSGGNGSGTSADVARKLGRTPHFLVGMGNDLANDHNQDGVYTLGVTRTPSNSSCLMGVVRMPRASHIQELSRPLSIPSTCTVPMAQEKAGFSEVWTNDRHMLAAAGAFGLQGRSV